MIGLLKLYVSFARFIVVVSLLAAGALVLAAFLWWL